MLDSEIPVQPEGTPVASLPPYLQMLIKDGSSGQMTGPTGRLQSIRFCLFLPPPAPPPSTPPLQSCLVEALPRSDLHASWRL